MEAADQSQTQSISVFSRRWTSILSVLLALSAGLLLRLDMLGALFDASDDTLVYGDIAKNLLLHGRYALTMFNGEPHSTLIRLPGYPLFLALCFRLFGMENYFSTVWIQIPLDLIACLLLADAAARIAPVRWRTGSAHCTLWLAALCPFTASYAVSPLTEAPTLFVLSLALWALVRFRERSSWGFALAFTFAITYAALLRPDGALVGVVLAPAMLLPQCGKDAGKTRIGRKEIRMAAVCLLLALLPFAVWTLRNWRVYHVFQPLAPQSASDPDQRTYPGWHRWVKTWCLDYVSTYDIYWQVPGSPFDLNKLPARAFDSPAQYVETARLVAAYNVRDHGVDMMPDVDAGFARLAAERIRAHPLRFYLWMPLGRAADMWLRPRVENLNIDVDWWVYAHHPDETIFSWEYVGLNAVYLLLGGVGFYLRPRFWPYMLAYFLLRSLALMTTVIAPEARYTIECFPMLFVLGGIALYRFTYWVLRSVLKLNASPGKG